jgi:hypothetical protein
MQIVIDLDTRKPQRSLTDSRTATQFDFKRGDDAIVEILFVRGGVQTQLTAGIAITFGVKLRGRYDSLPLVQSNDFTLSGSGATAKYIGYPSFNTEELNEALGIDDDESNDIAVLDLMGEISWTEPTTEILTSSETFAVRVNNDVNREDDAPPNALPSPSDWLDARAVRFDKAQTLTDAQKQSARANIDSMPEPIIRETAPVEAVAAVSARAVMVLAGPSLGNTFTIDGVVFEFVASAGSDPSIVYIGLDELAPEESWPTIIMAINANVASVSATFRSDDSELDIVADTAGTSGNSIAVSTIGGVSFIDSSYEVVETLVGGAAAIPATAAQAVGQLVRVGTAAPYTWHRVQTLSPTTFAPTTPTIAEITGLTEALAAKQPLDSDLTAYANAADAAARRALLALAPDTTGNTNLNAILGAGPAASRDAVEVSSRADSRLWHFRDAMHTSNGARPRICFIGDSMIGTARYVGLESAFVANFGQAGFGFTIGQETSPATLEKDACLKWITGETFLIPLTGIATFGGLSVATAVPANTIKIYYLRQPGGGHFKIQTERNGGAWTDEVGYTDIDTDGVLGGVVITITKADTQRWSNYRVRCVGLGNGSGGAGNVTIIGAGLYHTRQSGAIYSWMYNGSTDVPNNNTVSAKSTPRAITDPIFADLGLHLVVLSNYDGASSATNDLPVLLDNIKAGLATNGSNPLASFLIVGPPCGMDSTTDANTKAQAAAMRALCRARGDAFFDNRNWALPVSAALANGIIPEGDIHYAPLAVKQWVPLMFSELGLANHTAQGVSAVNEIRFKQGGIIRNQTVNGDSYLPVVELEGSFRLVNPPGVTGRAVLIFEDSAGPFDNNDVSSISYNADRLRFALASGLAVLEMSSGIGQGGIFRDAASSAATPKGVLGEISTPWNILHLGKSVATATGDRTASRAHGSVKFAAGSGTPIVVTNTFASTTANVLVTVYGADATLTSARVTRAAGSFTITPNAAATGETEVGWLVLP